MKTIEEALREVLEERADEAASAPVRIPRGLRSRVRRRQVRQGTAAVLAIAALGVAVALGAGRLAERDVRPGDGSEPTQTVLPPRDREWVVGHETVDGKPFELVVTRGVDGWCSGVRYGGPTGLGCPRTGEQPLQLGDFTGTDRPRIVHGAASLEVARVLLAVSRGGVRQLELHGPPPGTDAPFRVFGAVVPKQETIVIRALDERGRVLDRQRMEPELETPPAPIEPLLSADHPGAVVDIHENLWAYLDRSELDSDPSAAPGARRVPVETIRYTAGLQLDEVWEPAREWWRSRPAPDASDQAFLEWWRAYPFADSDDG